MNLQRFITLVGGDENLSGINRIFNIACIIGGLICILSGFECFIAGLSPYLVTANFFFTLILALSYYFSRFRHQFFVFRIFSIFTLIFIYTPLLWILNGGSQSGIPYFIPLFVSFLSILTITPKSSKTNRLISYAVLATFSLVVIVLILLEFSHPEIFYQYTDKTTQKIDIIVAAVFSLLGNYLIIMSFVKLYYRQLEKAEEATCRLEELVIRDSMTCLYNHAFALSCLKEEVDRAVRRNSALSVIMMDIDHFKKINDTYGHPFGDNVLKQLSQTFQNNCRSIDTVARYGGEEFLIILPDTTSQIASVIANRLLGLARNLKFENDVSVTVSAGIAGHIPGDTASSLIDRADSYLYKAKNAGRDQVKSQP